MLFHAAIIETKDRKLPFALWFDLQRKDIQTFAEAYNNNKDFFFFDRTINSSEVLAIYIYTCKRQFEKVKLPNNKTVKEEKNAKYIVDILSNGEVKGVDLVTQKFINTKNTILKPKSTQLNTNVFIVHGIDHRPVNQLKALLNEFGIIPIVLNEQPSRGSMTIIEKLEEYSDVGFAFVLLTPDDIGLKRIVISECYGAYNFGKDATNPEIIEWAKGLSKPIADFLLDKIQPSIQDRARQNVILEFGYFIGKLGRNKVCCLYNGDLELPSDMQGICYARFNNSIDEVKDLIINELRIVNILKP